MLKEFKKGFTLAEVLIVIGIIGVVAALTLPNLNHATGDKEKVTKVKKIYSALTEAVDRAQVIYGPCDEWVKGIEDDYAEINERFAKRITEFMKVSKDCGLSDGCFSDGKLQYVDGPTGDNGGYLSLLKMRNAYMVTLADGMSLGFEMANADPQFMRIRVDIDGPNKGKNMVGNDIFDFSIGTGKSSAEKTTNQLATFIFDEWCANDGSMCANNYYTQWVVEHGNLDYLKADWDGICPNGTVLNYYTQPSCN